MIGNEFGNYCDISGKFNVNTYSEELGLTIYESTRRPLPWSYFNK